MSRYNNRVKAIIAFFIMCIVTAFSLTACASRNMTSIKEKAKENGYDLESVDNRTVCVEDGDAKYYYNIWIFGVNFDRCEIKVEEEGVEVKKGEAIISIENENRNKVRVTVHDSRVLINSDGSEEEQYTVTYYICDKKFDASSIESKTMIDSDAKAEKAYKHVERFLTTEELKDYYDKALTIRDRLNG